MLSFVSQYFCYIFQTSECSSNFYSHSPQQLSALFLIVFLLCFSLKAFSFLVLLEFCMALAMKVLNSCAAIRTEA